MPPKLHPDPRKATRGAGVAVPIFVFALFGYASWVLVALLAVNHLLHPSNDSPVRHGAGVAIIVIYFFLLVIIVASYTRTLYTVHTNPGYVPLPDPREVVRLSRQPCGKPRRKSKKDSSKATEGEEKRTSTTPGGLSGESNEEGRTDENQAGRSASGEDSPSDHDTRTDVENSNEKAESHERKEDEQPPTALTKGYLDRHAVLDGRVDPPSGLEEFYTRDVFECDNDGLPKWCHCCMTWKPDRTHHSGEARRCVYKLDHYCPWAGGIVCETNFKFFVQFCFYTAIWCIFNVITLVYFLAKRGETGTERVLWIVTIAISGLFFLFTSGMSINALHFAFINSTTVDNMGRYRSRFLAIHSPQLSALGEERRRELDTHFTMVTFPLKSNGPYQPRTFAVLSFPSGKNLYRLPNPWDNFRQIMGNHWHQWFLPIGHSPSSDHGYASSKRDVETAVGEARFMYHIDREALDNMTTDAGLNDVSKIPKKKEQQVGSDQSGEKDRKASQDDTDHDSSTASESESDGQTSHSDDGLSSPEVAETEKLKVRTSECETGSRDGNMSEQTLVGDKDETLRAAMTDVHETSPSSESASKDAETFVHGEQPNTATDNLPERAQEP
ncbi:MAG: hypothetical protein Q9159_004849 [Coniocarpon cinnabarinum]